MAEELNETRKEEVLEDVVPTLFIALGGTGFEVLARIRRRILNTLWGSGKSKSVRIDSLNEFPLAEFLHIDLDANTVTQQGKALKNDILASKVLFKEEERLIKKLDLSKYVRTDEDLAKYPLIQEWFPLSRTKVNELNLNVEDGAGQIRSISRLYFFDKYQEIKNAIRAKAAHLLSNISTAESAKRLGLKAQTKMLKIVVVGSTAGGTGSGCFLDLGYLAQIVGKIEAHEGVTTNLVLMLPTGYQGANRTKTQANSYAALMELETCMRKGSQYVKQWSESESFRESPDNFYSNVYLVDTANLSGSKTENIMDLYDMVADALFEDFSTSVFANKKRSVIVNQAQHKTSPYMARVNPQVYGDMKLTFSRGYSSFGQATIDTHLEQKKNVILFQQVNNMLKAFFGVAAEDSKSNIPTEGERDELLRSRMSLGVTNHILDYDFVQQHEQYRKGAEQTLYPLALELLRVNGISQLDDIEKRIEDQFEEIRTSSNYKEWPAKIDELIRKINHDSFKQVETGTGLHEDAIRNQQQKLRGELLNPEKPQGLIPALWMRVDNKERGGLDFTIKLIRRIKDRLENANTGISHSLDQSAKWFSDLSGFLRNQEASTLQEHLQQAISKFFGAEAQAEAKRHQIADVVRLYVRYHLYGVACREAAQLVRNLSDDLGKQRGTDEGGNPLWDGFIDELESGRTRVRGIINEAEDQIARTQEAIKQSHAMYFVLPAPRSRLDELSAIPAATARQWAEEVFQDIGGTQELFALLKEDQGRSDLLGKLRFRALAMIGESEDAEDENPLFEALREYGKVSNLGQLFSDFMQRAMPWVAANVNKYLKEQNPNDQYKCYIGVKDSIKFKNEFGAELTKRLPTNTMMTAAEIGFVEIDTPGKVICYTELTGLPLPALRGLDDWYTSYREENAKTPVHTHRRTSRFVHPRELTTTQLDERASDFRLFIEAVSLGVLTRTDKGEDEGLYKLRIKGQARFIGDEKLLRLEGIDRIYRPLIAQQVEQDLEQLASAEQFALWTALMEYHCESSYPLATPTIDGLTREIKSLPTLICEQLVQACIGRLGKLIDERQVEQLLRTAREALHKWSMPIPGSDADVYLYEVNKNVLKPKRMLKREVLAAGWTLAQSSPTAAQPAFQSPQTATAPMGIPGGPPPIPQMSPLQVYVVMNGQQGGPFDLNGLRQLVQTGQLTRESLIWMQGMAEWSAAASVATLASVFGPTPPPIPRL